MGRKWLTYPNRCGCGNCYEQLRDTRTPQEVRADISMAEQLEPKIMEDHRNHQNGYQHSDRECDIEDRPDDWVTERWRMETFSAFIHGTRAPTWDEVRKKEDDEWQELVDLGIA